MNNNSKYVDNNGLDTLPWYKQFWPWFIFGLPGIVVVAAISTVIIAIKGADSVVSDNYYKEGLAINAVVEDINRAKAMHMVASIEVIQQGEGDNIWVVEMQTDTPLTPGNLVADLQHTADSNKDVTLVLAHAGDNRYRGQIRAIELIRWYIDIYPQNKVHVDGKVENAKAESWRLKGEINLADSHTQIKAVDD